MDKDARRKDILCFSGGVDSVAAWYSLGKPDCVYFKLLTPYMEKEIKNVRKFFFERGEKHKLIVDESLMGICTEDVFIPHRNLLFASRASQYGETVWMAGLKDDMVEDKTPEAFQAMGAVLSKIGKEPVYVKSPFWEMTKAQVCTWMVDNIPNGKKILLEETMSCYSNTSAECGACDACFRKSCALHTAGMWTPFHHHGTVIKYYRAALKRKYIPERCLDILIYVDWLNSQAAVEPNFWR